MVRLGRVALDGTKLRANASRHKAMSYERMEREEAKLEAELAELRRRPRRCSLMPRRPTRPRMPATGTRRTGTRSQRQEVRPWRVGGICDSV